MSVTTCALALAALPAGAHAAGTLTIDPSGSLLARGVGAAVTVTYSCSSDTLYSALNVAVTQARGRTMTQGSGSTESLVCDGTEKTATVIAQTHQGVFLHGVALAQAYMYTCTDQACTSTSSTREITLR
jgi:hypothetical protein